MQTIKERAIEAQRESRKRVEAQAAENRKRSVEVEGEWLTRNIRQVCDIGTEVPIMLRELPPSDDEDEPLVEAEVEGIRFVIASHGSVKIVAVCEDCGKELVSYALSGLSDVGYVLEDFHARVFHPSENESEIATILDPPMSLGDQLESLIERIASNVISNSPIINRLANQ